MLSTVSSWFIRIARDRYLPYAAICITGFLLYARSLNYDYTNFDDNMLIQDNFPFISKLSNIPKAFTHNVFLTGADLFYRPMQTILLILNANLGGTNLYIYHLSNVVNHLLASSLVFLFFCMAGMRRELSLILALVFTVHPALAQGVAWVPGGVDVFLTIGVVASFLAFLKYLEAKSRVWFALHILFFALAMFTKESAISLIPVCLLYLHFIVREEFYSGNKKMLGAGWLAVCLLWFYLRSEALKVEGGKSAAELAGSMLGNLPALLHYLGKIFFPFNLSVMPTMEDTTFVYGILAVAALGILVYVSGKEGRPLLIFGFGWFLLFLLPTFITTTEFRIPQFYEHRMYLPLAGFLLALSGVRWVRDLDPVRPVQLSAAFVLLLYLGLMNIRHVPAFAGTPSFLDNAIATSPHSPLAHRNMGIYCQSENLLDRAEKEYLRALELNPREKELHNNLGTIYMGWNRTQDAEREFITEMQINPVNDQSHYNLALIYYGTPSDSLKQKAEGLWKRALQLNPANLDACRQLVKYYLEKGDRTSAEQYANYLRSMEQRAQQGMQRPGAAEGLSTGVAKGVEMLKKGMLQEAGEVFKGEIDANPDNTAAWFYLGLAYFNSERRQEAEMAWKKVIELDPKHRDAYNNLAICLHQQGRNEEAEMAWKRLLQVDPEYIDAYYNLANFYLRVGKGAEAAAAVGEMKRRGVGLEQMRSNGVRMTPEMEELFSRQ